MNTFTSYRKVKRDGNCFYRALAFSISEFLTLHKNSTESKRIIGLLNESKALLLSVGYDLIGIEDFYDASVDLITSHDSILDMEKLFIDNYSSEATVCYFRLITAAMLKQRADFYSMFVDIELETFIATQVEPSMLFI